MTPEPLVFPRGMRYPNAEEVPVDATSDTRARVAEARRTTVTTGYVRAAPTGVTGYTHVYEANVHAPALWRVFEALVKALLPNVAAPIVGLIDEDPILGRYTSKAAALDALRPYADPLVNDGFLEFGCIFQRAGQTEEVFVHSSKFLTIWTSRPHDAEDVLEAHGIPEHPALRFIDEFPLVRAPRAHQPHQLDERPGCGARGDRGRRPGAERHLTPERSPRPFRPASGTRIV